MKNGVFIADKAFDPEMFSSLSDFEVNLELRYIALSERSNSPVQSGLYGGRSSGAYAVGYGRKDYDDKKYKKPHENVEGLATVRVQSVEAKVITGR